MDPKDPDRSVVDLARQGEVIERLRAHFGGMEPAARQSVVRAVAHIVADTHLEGRLGRFVIESDEPPLRGGDDLAPAPLQYLMAAVAF